MKKGLFFILMILIITLSSCTEVSLDYLDFELNPGIDTIDLGETHIDAGATAYYGLKELVVTVISNQVDSTEEGVYEIIYQTSHRDLVLTLVRKVTVKDQTPPVVTLNSGVDTVMVGEEWHDAGVMASDNSEGEVLIEVIGDVLDDAGRYEVMYRVTDPSGLQTTITRIVYVIERE